jgi:hypothetical protein
MRCVGAHVAVRRPLRRLPVLRRMGSYILAGAASRGRRSARPSAQGCSCRSGRTPLTMGRHGPLHPDIAVDPGAVVCQCLATLDVRGLCRGVAAATDASLDPIRARQSARMTLHRRPRVRRRRVMFCGGVTQAADQLAARRTVTGRSAAGSASLTAASGLQAARAASAICCHIIMYCS